MKGFEVDLNEEEKAILDCFRQSREIAFPTNLGLSLQETLKVLRQLQDKQYITGRAPYRLTKKGCKYINGSLP